MNAAFWILDILKRLHTLTVSLVERTPKVCLHISCPKYISSVKGYNPIMEGKLTSDLIAPCGMNCGICKCYLAYSRGVPYQKGKVSHCSGCIARNKTCAFIKKDCEKLKKKQIRFCYECADMPCGKLAHIDEHYSARYGMSMLENQKMIKEKGMDEFLKNQAERYRCPSCGDLVSVHDGKCYACGYQGEKPLKKVGKAQWDKARWIPDRK